MNIKNEVQWAVYYTCLFQIPWGMFWPRIGNIGWHV